MTYSKVVTAKILHFWGLGFTTEETVKTLGAEGVYLSASTVNRHRHNLTAQQITDELMREQRRDIAKCDAPALRMKYRDLILAKIVPQQIESTMTIAGTPFDVNPELRKALLEESERQRREKENVKFGATSSGRE